MVEALAAVTTTGNAPFAIQPITVDDLRSGEMIDQTNWTVYVTNWASN